MHHFDFSAADVVDFRWEKTFRAKVYSNGKVSWDLSGRFETYCSVNMALFPFDTQECKISVGTPVPISYINALAVDEYATEQHSLSNEEFEVSLKRSSTKYEEFEGVKFAKCHFPIILRRRPSYYVVNILMPVALLSLMSFTPFALPVDSGERVSLLITAFLALSVYELILTEYVPITSIRIPVLSKYYDWFNETKVWSLLHTSEYPKTR